MTIGRVSQTLNASDGGVDRPLANLGSLDPAIRARVAMTVSCPDADVIPKVVDAGTVRDERGGRVQVMHNGVLVEEGGYFGDWMAEIIRTLRGHHEPQEERVFNEIVRRLGADRSPAGMIEFGSFWTYYGLWFCRAVPSARVVGVEPDPAYLEVGRRNAALNDLSDRITFLHAAIGAQPGQQMAFRAESDGQDYQVDQCDLASVLEGAGMERADLVLADVQGAETTLLELGVDVFRSGRVRFLMVSTHHHSISGDPLTHQRALRLLTDLGAHVICEHTVLESFSGDGLIAVSFDERDRDLVIEVSRARSKESMYGEPEYELGTIIAQRVDAQRQVEAAQAAVDRTRAELADVKEGEAGLKAQLAVAESERHDLRGEIARILQTRMWRWSQRPRRLYARVRSLRSTTRG